MEGQNPESPDSGVKALIQYKLNHRNSDAPKRKSSVFSFTSDSNPTKKGSFLSSRASFMESFRNLRALTLSKFGFKSSKTAENGQNPSKPSIFTRCMDAIERSEFNKRKIRLQKIIYLMLEDPGSSKTAKFVFIFLISCIFFTLIEAMLDSYNIPEITNSTPIIVLEWITSITFTIELVLRCFACTAFGAKRWVYMLRPLILIDIIGLIPFYVNLDLPSDNKISTINTLKALRVIRFVRIVRILKLGRYMAGTETFLTGLYTSLVSLGFIIYFVFVGNLSFAVMLFYAEYGSTFDIINEPGKLVRNVGESMWWAIVTMTTTGYGDRVPQTTIGKVIGFSTALVGMFLLAIPIVILGNNFQRAFINKQEADRVERYKERQRNENAEADEAQREIRFMTDRIELIEKTNNDITSILNDSKKIYYSVARDLKHMYRSIYAEDEKKVEEQKKEEVAAQHEQVASSTINNKIKIMEKLQKAKRKIKIASLFPKGLAGLRGTNSEMSESRRKSLGSELGGIVLSRDSSKRLSITDQNSNEKSLKKEPTRQITQFELPEGEEDDCVETLGPYNVNRVQISSYENKTTDFSVSPTRLRPFTGVTGKEETKINKTTEFRLTKVNQALIDDDENSGMLPYSPEESMISDCAQRLESASKARKRDSLTSRARKRKSGRRPTISSRELEYQAEKTKRVLNIAVKIVELLGEPEAPDFTGPLFHRNPLAIKTERKSGDSIEVVVTEDSTDEQSEKQTGEKTRVGKPTI